jgi:hypothetical protein
MCWCCAHACITHSNLLLNHSHSFTINHSLSSNRSQSLTITHNRLHSLTITHNRLHSLTITHNRLQSLTIAYNRLQSLTIAYNRLQSLTIAHNHSQSLTFAHPLPKQVLVLRSCLVPQMDGVLSLTHLTKLELYDNCVEEICALTEVWTRVSFCSCLSSNRQCKGQLVSVFSPRFFAYQAA